MGVRRKAFRFRVLAALRAAWSQGSRTDNSQCFVRVNEGLGVEGFWL